MPDTPRALAVLHLLRRIAAAEARRLLLLQWRHRLEFCGSVITLYAAFALLHSVARRVPMPFVDVGGTVLGQAMLYALWMWCYGIVGGVQGQAAADLATGALEPLYASGVPTRWLNLGRAAGFALQSAAVAAGLVIGVLVLAGAGASRVSWPAVVVASGLGFVTSAGVAIGFVGLVLVFRRVSVLMTPVSILLMGVMMSPARDLPRIADAVPWVAPKRLMAEALGGVFDVSSALAGAVVSLAVLALGLGVHAVFERHARATGRLSLA